VPASLKSANPGWVVRSSESNRWPGPLAPFDALWRHRDLIGRLAWQGIVVRYRGSLLGSVWSVLSPLLTLSIFTLVFGVIFGSRWSDDANTVQYALLLYLGLCVFWLVSECVGEATSVISNHASYVKKVVFPLEVLPWTLVVIALFHSAIRLAIFVVAWAVFEGMPPLTIVFLPAVYLPLVLSTVGLVYVISCAGALVRDLREGISLLLTALMFLSPIFYPLHTVPEAFRPLVLLNPLTLSVELVRDVAAFGKAPDPIVWVWAVLASWVFAWLGAAIFARVRGVFADVV
jgi:lipopolysaccharide transport system permease protein